VLETGSDVSDDGVSDRERSDHDTDDNGNGNSDNDGSDNGDDDGLQDVPMNGWEEFDEDAAYQKKRVNPEMRQWILTKDCRRIISDEHFNNPSRGQGMHNLLTKE